ncbi:MAG: triose-phosphate isomerase [Methanomassiliicoccales archaeon]|nr:triose-phosphate isomerase [Methanomassiliicoccales archaeon]
MTELKTPVIVINFKVYSEVEGTGALRLAKECETVAKEKKVNFVVCPPMVELSKVASSVSIPVFSQHVDPRAPGSITGYASPQSVKAAGARGTLINHAEHRMKLAEVKAAVNMCKENDLVSIVCTKDVRTSRLVARFAPDFIAVEPPELIGGDISVTTADPKIVSDTVAAVKGVDPKVKVLCGAGVKNGRDVVTAIELGASGVLLASGVVKAKDVKAVLMDLVASL